MFQLPPIPDVAARLNQMRQSATLAPIQQAQQQRGQVFQPSLPRGGGNGLAQGAAGLGEGLKTVAAVLKERQEEEKAKGFVDNFFNQFDPQSQTMPPSFPDGPTGDTAQQVVANKQNETNPFFTEAGWKTARAMKDAGQYVPLMGILQTRMMQPPKEPETFDLGPDQVRFRMGPGGTPEEIARGVPKLTVPDSIAQYEYAVRQNGYGGTFEQWKKEMAAAGRGTTTVNLPPLEGKYDETRGKQLAETRGSLQENAAAARAVRNRVTQASSLLGEINTGALAPSIQGAKRFAKGLGVDLEKMGFKDDVAPAEAFQAITGQFLMGYIQQTKGAISEKENELFQSFSPNLSKTREGNALLLDWADRLAKREIEIDRLAAEYENKHGRLDPAWPSYLDRWTEANPLLNEADIKKATALSGTSGADTLGAPAPVVTPGGVATDKPDPAAAAQLPAGSIEAMTEADLAKMDRNSMSPADLQRMLARARQLKAARGGN